MKLLLVLSLFLGAFSSHKILVYNVKFGHSHSNYMGTLADTLAAAGHEVHSLIPEIDPNLKDGTVNSTVIRIPQSPDVIPHFNRLMYNPDANFFSIPVDSPLMPIIVGPVISATFSTQCRATLDHPGLLQRLKEEQYDVFINENFDYCGLGAVKGDIFACTFGGQSLQFPHFPVVRAVCSDNERVRELERLTAESISHVIGARALVVVSSTVLFENVARDLGIPLPSSYVPGFFTSTLDSSLLSRAKNALNIWQNYIFLDWTQTVVQNVFLEKFGPNFPEMGDITANAALVLTNAEPLIDHAMPTLKKVVDLGGIGAKPPLPVNEYWNGILSQRARNVVVSFGSIAKSIIMPREMQLSVLKAFESIPDTTFIWKYEDPEDEFAKEYISKVKNVVVNPWMPQNDLLGDARVTAFISHAGAGSTLEAAKCGLPSLFVPLFGEQPRNALTMKKNGMARVYMKYELVDTEKFVAAIKEVMEEKKLKNRAVEISKFLAARPFTPQELLLKNVDFVARFGHVESLTPRGVRLNFVQRNNLDLWAIGTVSSILCAYLTFSCLRFSIRLLVKRKSKEE